MNSNLYKSVQETQGTFECDIKVGEENTQVIDIYILFSEADRHHFFPQTNEDLTFQFITRNYSSMDFFY